jgi:hypothetical protein
MAQRRLIQIFDDLEGGPADETVMFALDGKSYAIDLSAANAAQMRVKLAPFVEVARRTNGRPSGRSVTRSLAGRRQEVREWASSQGIVIAGRGRIPQSVLAAFDKARSSG